MWRLEAKGALSLGSMESGPHIEQLGGNAFVYGRLFDGQSMTLSLEGPAKHQFGTGYSNQY